MGYAHYLAFKKDGEGSIGRVGGLPTVIPAEKPWPDEDDEYLGFALELKVDGEILKVPGASYIQLYQPIDEGSDPTPIVAVVKGSEEEGQYTVNRHPCLLPMAIDAVQKEEPDELPALTSPEIRSLFKSKLGGIDVWDEAGDRQFLGHLCELPVDFNFGGFMCLLYLRSDGSVDAELH